MEAEVEALEQEKAALDSQLAVDAETNAAQVETIRQLTVTESQSLRFCRLSQIMLVLFQEEAASHTAELDSLEAQCSELQAELSDKEGKLKQIQELERKCSREYIAYEKAKAKTSKAKEVKIEKKPFS